MSTQQLLMQLLGHRPGQATYEVKVIDSTKTLDEIVESMTTILNYAEASRASVIRIDTIGTGVFFTLRTEAEVEEPTSKDPLNQYEAEFDKNEPVTATARELFTRYVYSPTQNVELAKDLCKSILADTGLTMRFGLLSLMERMKVDHVQICAKEDCHMNRMLKNFIEALSIKDNTLQ